MGTYYSVSLRAKMCTLQLSLETDSQRPVRSKVTL
jgi:hypothetical protein